MRRNVPTVSVDADTFKSYLNYRKVTIRTLAKRVDVDERYIRKAISNGSIGLMLALDICELFGARFETVFGPQDRWAVGGFAKRISECL